MDGSIHTPNAVRDAARDWVRRAERQRLDLHRQAAEPGWIPREKAFTGMSDALVDAIAEVQRLSELIFEQSQQMRRDVESLCNGRPAGPECDETC